MGTGSRRLSQKKPATATDRPAMEPTLSTSTRRWPKGVRPSLRRSGMRLTTHSTMPDAAMKVPTTPLSSSSQRVAGSAKRPRCTPVITLLVARTQEMAGASGLACNWPVTPSKRSVRTGPG